MMWDKLFCDLACVSGSFISRGKILFGTLSKNFGAVQIMQHTLKSVELNKEVRNWRYSEGSNSDCRKMGG